ncbi:hypothetical protein Poli38472_013064 [Pythium oligandrum]|uniref:Coiled-coil domain-containing protein 130 n=1 Tax=Pythium oligandrum TaxID=41045 RepID=A0A8K1FM31_PYTOL|nr:hypothetical protein Poli38472_013064 [Pythium oligandrum]|eukprot:TMW64442.1 hypothetical protein Poli38472_013064 [Pythium oligandrum]
MSSLAAARADNFYYPKDWRPEDGSINKFHKSHPLGKRAKDIKDGVLVIRFEMPFNVWCTHCDVHIGRGVRYNAKKKRVGKYFTTSIYEFRMTCTNCQGELVIETDPENRGYKLVSGVKKQTTVDDVEDKAEDTGIVEEMETERLNDAAVGLQLAADPFFKLEHEQSDKRRAKQRAQGIEAIQHVQDAQYRDNYASNAALRAQFRQKKKHLKQNADRAENLGLGITLVDAQDEDVALSKAMVFKGIQNKRRSSADKHGAKRKPTKRASEDSFQHFGDTMGSQLHRLKRRKQEERKGARVIKPVAKSGGDRVAGRAKKLLLQRQ